MLYLIIGIYLLGCIVHFRMFMREEDHIIDGWGLVFTGLYFSLLSWFAVIISWCFNTKSTPPKWLTNKIMKLELNFYKSSGKWYTKEVVECRDFAVLEKQCNTYYPTMDYTVHIIAPDGMLQPYRMFKR